MKWWNAIHCTTRREENLWRNDDTKYFIIIARHPSLMTTNTLSSFTSELQFHPRLSNEPWNILVLALMWELSYDNITTKVEESSLNSFCWCWCDCAWKNYGEFYMIYFFRRRECVCVTENDGEESSIEMLISSISPLCEIKLNLMNESEEAQWQVIQFHNSLLARTLDWIFTSICPAANCCVARMLQMKSHKAIFHFPCYFSPHSRFGIVNSLPPRRTRPLLKDITTNIESHCRWVDSKTHSSHSSKRLVGRKSDDKFLFFQPFFLVTNWIEIVVTLSWYSYLVS
jgi:hypothetical protein